PLLLLIAALLFISCGQPINKQTPRQLSRIQYKVHIPTIEEIPLPDGYIRVNAEANSFTSFLRSIKLKKNKAVYLYNEKTKKNQSAQ
ncbi:MAG: hypothetical protein ACM3H8_10210, partial [Sphingobacteriales bacterium]